MKMSRGKNGDIILIKETMSVRVLTCEIRRKQRLIKKSMRKLIDDMERITFDQEEKIQGHCQPYPGDYSTVFDTSYYGLSVTW
jgi:hypothetical protein